MASPAETLVDAAYQQSHCGRLGWLYGVRDRSWSTGRVVVGSADRVMIVGQAPAKGFDGLAAFAGSGGRRLRRLLEVGELEFRSKYDVMNAWPWFPGKRGKGDAFDVLRARELMSCVRFRCQKMLVLGAAAKAMGLRCGEFARQSLKIGVLVTARPGGAPGVFEEEEFWVDAYYVPHPSGVNRWWNELENVQAAARFFKEVQRW